MGINGLLTVGGGTVVAGSCLRLALLEGWGQMKGILLGAAAVILGTAVYVMVGIALASVG